MEPPDARLPKLILVTGFAEVLSPRIMELPRYEAEGAPAGVKLAADDGGGPAGVVEGWSSKRNIPPREVRSGVDGGGLSSGTENWGMLAGDEKRESIRRSGLAISRFTYGIEMRSADYSTRVQARDL